MVFLCCNTFISSHCSLVSYIFYLMLFFLPFFVFSFLCVFLKPLKLCETFWNFVKLCETSFWNFQWNFNWFLKTWSFGTIHNYRQSMIMCSVLISYCICRRPSWKPKTQPNGSYAVVWLSFWFSTRFTRKIFDYFNGS